MQLIIFSIVCIAWIFFRANSLLDAQKILVGILTNFDSSIIFDKQTYLIGFKTNEFKIIVISIILLFIFERIHFKFNLISLLNKQGVIFRCFCYLIIVFSIVIFGIYGDRDIQDFIYFQF